FALLIINPSDRLAPAGASTKLGRKGGRPCPGQHRVVSVATPTRHNRTASRWRLNSAAGVRVLVGVSRPVTLGLGPSVCEARASAGEIPEFGERSRTAAGGNGSAGSSISSRRKAGTDQAGRAPGVPTATTNDLSVRAGAPGDLTSSTIR